MKVPKEGDLKKKGNGSGLLNFVRLPFCLPKPKSTSYTEENSWMNEWTVPNREE